MLYRTLTHGRVPTREMKWHQKWHHFAVQSSGAFSRVLGLLRRPFAVPSRLHLLISKVVDDPPHG